jgi:PAS domain S-box-containing protein
MHGNRALFEATDWAATPLGPVAGWPADMRAVVETALSSGFPVCTGWGDAGIQIYNDAYNPIFGDKHPASFGRPVGESWPEIWEFLGPAIEQVRRTREPMTFHDALLPLAKHGVPEECWFDFSYSAVGGPGPLAPGVISIAVEKTRDVVLARRHASCDIPLDAMADGGLEALARVLGERLRGNPMDAAAAALVSLDPQGGATAGILLELGDWPALATFAGLPRAGGGEVAQLRADVPGKPAEVGDRVALVPLLDDRRRPLAMLALAPHALVPADGHLDFAGALSDRLQRILAHAGTLGAYREHIAEQDALYRFLFDNIVDAVLYARTDGGADSSETVVAANPGACELFGYAPDELPGLTRDQLMFPDDTALRRALLRREQEGVFKGELTFRRKDGTPVPAEVGSRLVTSRDGTLHSVNIIRDASLRASQAAERARQARFEAIAQLTAGMAHDFNNLLTVVQGSLELLLEDLPEGTRGREYAANALLCAERGAALTGQLLAYSRRQLLHLQPEDLDARLHELLPLVRATVGDRIEVVLEPDGALPPCRTDIAQLTTAVLNLAANARDAMPAGGRLLLQTQRAPDAPDQAVLLRVRDTGSGVPPELADRIFEPYFTTKALGAGLGLAMVQGFVHQSGGSLRVAPAPGGGALFELRLPVAAAAATDAPGPADARAATAPAPAEAGSRHLLLVDDNPLIREQASDLLERAGYRVDVAADGEQALVMLAELAPDLLLTDLDMPGRDGLALAREARALRPALRVLIMTGHAPAGDAGASAEAGIVVLAKPFGRGTLLATIERLLAG